jgi:hypothetical protein
VLGLNASQFALLNCTLPGRGKSQAIEHNRALPKVSQSLRSASLGGLPLRALRVRVMVGYVLRPSPDNSYFGCDRLVRLRGGGVGRFRAGERRRWPALPVVSWWKELCIVLRLCPSVILTLLVVGCRMSQLHP